MKKLDLLMEREGLNKNSFAKKCGIPYTTIDGFYKKGYENAKLSTLKKISSFFCVSLDYLVRDCEDDISWNSFSKEENELVLNYRELNGEGKEYITKQMSFASCQPEYKKCSSDSLGFEKNA